MQVCQLQQLCLYEAAQFAETGCFCLVCKLSARLQFTRLPTGFKKGRSLQVDHKNEEKDRNKN